MNCLAKNGYTGYLAPENPHELPQAVDHFIEQKGDKAVVELLKEHPDFEVLTEIKNSTKKEIIRLLDEAYVMGKRMDAKLREYKKNYDEGFWKPNDHSS